MKNLAKSLTHQVDTLIWNINSLNLAPLRNSRHGEVNIPINIFGEEVKINKMTIGQSEEDKDLFLIRLDNDRENPIIIYLKGSLTEVEFSPSMKFSLSLGSPSETYLKEKIRILFLSEEERLILKYINRGLEKEGFPSRDISEIQKLIKDKSVKDTEVKMENLINQGLVYPSSEYEGIYLSQLHTGFIHRVDL